NSYTSRCSSGPLVDRERHCHVRSRKNGKAPSVCQGARKSPSLTVQGPCATLRFLRGTRMLTGYNQDVQAGDELLHVQTEDKGRDKAILETLVYRGGTIIAAKRTSYADQLGAGTLTDEGLGDMIKKQHQIIVAILKAGKVEELVRASQRAASRDSDGAE